MIVDDYWSLMIDHDWWSLMIVDDYWSLMIIDDHWWLLSKSRWQGLLNCYFSPPMNWVGYFVLLKRCLNVVVLVSPPRDRTIQSYIYIYTYKYIYIYIYISTYYIFYIKHIMICVISMSHLYIYIYMYHIYPGGSVTGVRKWSKLLRPHSEEPVFAFKTYQKKRSVYCGNDNPSITSAPKRATTTFSHIEDHRA